LDFILASVLFAALYGLLGIGLTLWMSPAFLRARAWVLAPWIGYGWAVLAGWYGYRLEMPGTQSYIGFVLAPPALAALAWWVRPGLGLQRNVVRAREVAAPLALGILILTVVSLPFISRHEGLTIFSLVNADAADTDSLAAFFTAFPRSESRGFLGQSSHYFRWLADSFVFGGPMSIAVATVVLPFETWELQHASISAFFALGAVLLYVLAHSTFHFTRTGALGLMAVYGLNSLMYFAFYQNYQAQVIATGLTLAIALVLLSAWRSASSGRDWIRCAALLALLNWGLSITYAHMLTLGCSALLVGFVAMAWYEKRTVRLLPFFGMVACGLFGMAAMYPPRVPDVVRALAARSSEVAGWFIPWQSPEAIVGLTLKTTDLAGNPPYLRFVLSDGVLAMGAWGWRRIARRDAGALVFPATVVAAVILGYIVLCYAGSSDGVWGGYKSYKLISFFLPFVLLGACLLFQSASAQPRNKRELVVLACLVALLVGNLYSARTTLRHMAGTARVVTADMIELRRLADDGRVHSVNILGNDWWMILWEARFLMTKKLFFETSTYSGRAASELLGEWDLIRLAPETSALFASAAENPGGMILVNSTYLLRPHLRPNPGQGGAHQE
jgi:hypothetical protein